MGNPMNRLPVLSGSGFGALLGVLIGLSISDVVAAFLTSAVAIAAAILGIAPLPEKARVKLNQYQLVTFALACMVFLFAGILIRTHNILAPSTESQIAEVSKWRKAGISAEYATRIVTGVAQPSGASPITVTTDGQIDAFNKWVKAGVQPEQALRVVTGSSAPTPSQQTQRMPSTQGQPRDLQTRERALLSVLSSGDPVAVCANIDPAQIPNNDDRLRTLKANDLTALADRISREPADKQSALYEAAWRILCR
jgi:hypothetical protein